MKLKKIYLEPTIQLMQGVSLERADSRKRSAFVKRLVKENEQFKNDKDEIMKSYIPKDKDGKELWKVDPRTEEPMPGHFDPTDPAKMAEELKELLEEEVVISKTKDNQAAYDRLVEIVANYDEELSGDMAAIYEVLCEAFEIEAEVTF